MLFHSIGTHRQSTAVRSRIRLNILQAATAFLILLSFFLILVTIALDHITGGIPLEDTLLNFMIRRNLSSRFFIFSSTFGQNIAVGILSYIVLLAALLVIWRFLFLLRQHSHLLIRIVLLLADLAVCGAALVSAFLLASSMLLNSYSNSLFGDPEWNKTALNLRQARREALEKELNDSGKDPGQALHEIMTAVETGKINIQGLSDDDYIDLAERVCFLVDAKGSVSTPEEHYFRNYFDRAPATLSDMVHTIRSTSNEPFHWRLLPIQSTLYHMIGPDGEYNLKFLSRDGHFEVVYNKKGQKLSASFAPWNMGTFNYSSPLDDLRKHAKYDVDTYLKWKNTPDSPPIPHHLTRVALKQFQANPDAQKHYRFYASLCRQTKRK